MPSINAHGGVKTPPYGPPHQRVPAPTASSRGSPSTGSHPRRGRRPRRPGNLPSPPIPGKTPGPGMPGPYRAAVGKPHAVHKRPRRGQDPSLRTAPSTSARPYSACVNSIRRAGCPHPAASSRGYPSTGSHPRRGRRPLPPEVFCRRPSPGHPPGRACPAPTARGWASPMPSINAHGGVKTPPYGPPHQRVPAPTASSRGSPSTGSHPRRGRRPRRPGNLPSPPIPGKTPGPGMPGPYRAAVGKPHAVHKRPRRGQDPSLRTAPSTSARPYRKFARQPVNGQPPT